jgi:hypothetical protein
MFVLVFDSTIGHWLILGERNKHLTMRNICFYINVHVHNSMYYFCWTKNNDGWTENVIFSTVAQLS